MDLEDVESVVFSADRLIFFNSEYRSSGIVLDNLDGLGEISITASPHRKSCGEAVMVRKRAEKQARNLSNGHFSNSFGFISLSASRVGLGSRDAHFAYDSRESAVRFVVFDARVY